MKLEGRKIKINKNAAEAYDYLSNMGNYESLMPDNIDKFSLHESGKGFKVGLKNMPEIGMKLNENDSKNTMIRFSSPVPVFQYDLDVLINPIDESTSEVQLIFNGNFNPMIEMVAKKPITKFINTITDKAEDKLAR